MLEYWNVGNREMRYRRRPLRSAVDRLATVSPSSPLDKAFIKHTMEGETVASRQLRYPLAQLASLQIHDSTIPIFHYSSEVRIAYGTDFATIHTLFA